MRDFTQEEKKILLESVMEKLNKVQQMKNECLEKIDSLNNMIENSLTNLYEIKCFIDQEKEITKFHFLVEKEQVLLSICEELDFDIFGYLEHSKVSIECFLTRKCYLCPKGAGGEQDEKTSTGK